MGDANCEDQRRAVVQDVIVSRRLFGINDSDAFQQIAPEHPKEMEVFFKRLKDSFHNAEKVLIYTQFHFHVCLESLTIIVWSRPIERRCGSQSMISI